MAKPLGVGELFPLEQRLDLGPSRGRGEPGLSLKAWTAMSGSELKGSLSVLCLGDGHWVPFPTGRDTALTDSPPGGTCPW